MQRYFVQPEQIAGNIVTIRGDDAHHISRVMRFQSGDTVIVCDDSGSEFYVQLDVIDGETVTGCVMYEQSAEAEPRLRVTLAQSLLKGDKLDWVIQKGTELGAHAFLPFNSERSVVRLSRTKVEKRRERWQKIAKEASEQAHRGRVPDVSAPIGWYDLLARVASYDVVVIPYEREQAQSLPLLWQTLPEVASCLCIIGPEGGFEPHEVEAAQEAGARPIHLGPRILRAETAALTTIACMMWASGEMEGIRS